MSNLPRAVALALLVATAKAMPAMATQPLASVLSDESVEYVLREHFASFEKRFTKSYESAKHREAALLTFTLNLEKIVSKNAKLAAEGHDQIHGITQFADMTDEEFRATMLPKIRDDAPKLNVPVAKPLKDATNVKTFDWRDHGVVTSVKDQQRCGSCWAHSAVETVESAFALAGNDLTALSVQQVVSCDHGNGDMGCEGGLYVTAWEKYVEAAHGLTTEEEYPYDEKTAWGMASKCDKSKASDVVPGTTPMNISWACEPCESSFCQHQDEETLKANLISHGPISVACDASEWSSYSGGVVTSSTCANSGEKLDHAIQLVGFNTDAETPYWIVRNSWNTGWGNDGYIYLKMGENTCGIADEPAFVTLQAAPANA